MLSVAASLVPARAYSFDATAILLLLRFEKRWEEALAQKWSRAGSVRSDRDFPNMGKFLLFRPADRSSLVVSSLVAGEDGRKTLGGATSCCLVVRKFRPSLLSLILSSSQGPRVAGKGRRI